MNPTQILIVEDESATALDIETQLIESGYEIIKHVTSPEEAIQQTTALHPDLVLMDVTSNGLTNCIETATTIRQTLHIPTVYLTSQTDEPFLRKMQEAEIYGCYLLKPFGDRELHSAIQMTLYHHRVEERLRESESRLTAFVKAIPDLAFILDKNGTTVELVPKQKNPLYDEIRQRSETGVIFPPEVITAITTAIKQTLQTGHPQTIEYQLELASGQHWFEGTISAMQAVDNQPERVVLLSRDITEHKQNEVMLKTYSTRLEEEVKNRTRALREVVVQLRTSYAEKVEAENALTEAHQQLQELDELKDNFLSGISHELRTPIANLKIYHHLLKNKPENSASYLEALESTTQRLETIVERMLYITRMYRELDGLANIPVDLNHLIENSLADHLEVIKERNLHLKFEPQFALPTINGDSNMLTRVVHNLLSNTTHYTEEGGQITIATTSRQTETNKTIQMTISNTGPQIPEEELPLIFDRFYRGGAALQFGVPGAGLGLYVSQMIVERHGGEIKVHNFEAGRKAGTTFTISFTA